jgi:acetyl-CoA carboxylase biotin carboxyl carrier protein
MKDKLLEVIEILNKYDLNEVEYESEGIKVKVRKDNKSIVQNNDFTNNLTSNSYEFEKAEKIIVEYDGDVVKSPISGTFYERPNPETSPFVKIGDKVKKGQPLAIIESMKVMNEICAHIDGIVTQILATNESNVEKDQVLFVIK